MLSKRTNCYEIQKPISPTKPTSAGSKNSRSGKKITTSSSIEASNSFNYSRSRVVGPPQGAGLQPAAITSLAASNNNVNFVRRSTKQPKMGIPVMTSTPTRTSVGRDSSTEEEPIYCEIPSPGKRPLPPPPALLSNRSCGLRTSLRSTNGFMQQGATTRMMLKTNGAIASSVGLLGRRAITQLDMSASAALARQSLATGINGATAHTKGIARGSSTQQHNKWTLEVAAEATVSPSEECRRSSTEVPSRSTTTIVSSASASETTTSLLKGVLWQQREKRFSRWKERFFMLTNDYLQCFRRGTSKLSEMGSFIYRIRLCEIEEIDLVERRGYLTLRLSLQRDGGGRLLLRKTDGIRKWHQCLQEAVKNAKNRKSISQQKSTEEFWKKRQHTDSSAMESWILSRKDSQYCWSDTASCISETASTTILPNHHSNQIKHRPGDMYNLETASTASGMGQHARKSYNNLKTTHYGLIDWPSPSRSSKIDRKVISSPTSNGALVNRILNKESMVNQSHDSGVDSMNTNSSGSMMSSRSPIIDSEKFSRQITLV